MCLLGFFPLSGLLLHVLPTPTSAAGSALASVCSGCCCEQRVWAPGALLLCCSLFAHVAKGIVDPLLVTAQTCSYRRSLGDKLVMIFCPSSALLPLALRTLGLVPRERALTVWLCPFAPNDSGEHPSENKRGGFVEANICSCANWYLSLPFGRGTTAVQARWLVFSPLAGGCCRGELCTCRLSNAACGREHPA